VRGKGLVTLALLPLRLLRAFWQALQVVRRVKPDVVVGLGGYITFPGGMMGVLCGKPLVLHEQNSVAGMANKVLAGVADRVFTAFPNVLKKASGWATRCARRSRSQAGAGRAFCRPHGPLRLLVVGGSLGAQALNDIVPQALALIPPSSGPMVTHQSGATQIDAAARQLRSRRRAGRADALHRRHGQRLCRGRHHRLPRRRQHRDRDCRRGCCRVFVPFPAAVDDHQTTNAQFLVDAGGGWLVQQRDLTPKGWRKCY
jgi:UDP-N-acetylglucosamine--N-acetylmuramyl-(pentapeptide) pyrophosphoryl-undecaprenol N-acetylglucosamine transferase